MDNTSQSFGLPPRPAKDAAFSEWRRWAWSLGMAAAHNPDWKNAESYVRLAVKVAGRPEEEVAPLVESLQTAMRRCRKPPNAPEQAAGCIRWYESRWGTVRLADGRIGRSPDYPKLLMLAYCLGRDGKPFAFADSRIGKVASCNPNTVRRFVARMILAGVLIEVRGGLRGTRGVAAWYRFASVSDVEKMLGVDIPSPLLDDHGLTFRQYVESTLGF